MDGKKMQMELREMQQNKGWEIFTFLLPPLPGKMVDFSKGFPRYYENHKMSQREVLTICENQGSSKWEHLQCFHCSFPLFADIVL